MNNETSMHRPLVYETPISVSSRGGCRCECIRSARRAEIAGQRFSWVGKPVSIVINAPVVSESIARVEGHGHGFSGRYCEVRPWRGHV